MRAKEYADAISCVPGRRFNTAFRTCMPRFLNTLMPS
jgi:hypothetical protein